MDSPIAAAKSAINISFIVKLLVGIIVVSALAELTGTTQWILTPINQLKSKFGSG